MPPQDNPVTPSIPPVPPTGTVPQPVISPLPNAVPPTPVSVSTPPAVTQPGFQQPGLPGQPAPPYQDVQLNPAYGHDNLAIASLILGIISIVTSILTIFTIVIPITGIVLGFISLKRRRGFAIAGITLSIIGILLSVLFIVLAFKLDSNKKSASSSSSSSTSSASQNAGGGSTIDSACFSLNLPTEINSSDISENKDCKITAINSDGKQDLQLSAIDAPIYTTDSQIDAALKKSADGGIKAIASRGSVTSSKSINVAGARAYEVLGTERGASYKYFSLLIVYAQKNYQPTAGTNARVFIIGADSATNPNLLEEVVKSWVWK